MFLRVASQQIGRAYVPSIRATPPAVARQKPVSSHEDVLAEIAKFARREDEQAIRAAQQEEIERFGLDAGAYRAAMDGLKYANAGLKKTLRKEIEDALSESGHYKGTEVYIDDLPRDEDGDLTDEAWEEHNRREEEIVNALVEAEFVPFNTLYDIDRQARTEEAVSFANDYLGASDEEKFYFAGPSGSAYAEISRVTATGEEESIKVRIANHERQAFDQEPADMVWLTSDADKNGMFGYLESGMGGLLANIESFNKGGGMEYNQTAYHGSPHKFEKFMLDHIGTGEGSQAFGWGLYFAGSNEVGEYYREVLSGKKLIDAMRDAYDEYSDPDEAIDALRNTAGLNEQQRELLDALAEDDWLGFDYPHHAVSALFMERKSFKIYPRTEAALKSIGHVYQVDIPEDSDLLDYDAPLSEQPEKVKDALENAGVVDFENNKMGDGLGAVPMFKNVGTYTGKEIYRRIVERGFKGEKEVTSAARKRAEKSASEYLNSIGIPGLRYLDGNSRSKGEGSHNYVIFDDNAIQMLETYYQGAGKRGSFNPATNTIRLLENADRSTFLHETGHFFLEMQANLANQLSGKAGGDLNKLTLPQRMLFEEMNQALKWLKVPGGMEGWNGMTPEQKRPYHEQFAQGFEAYLRTGKAPTPKMRDVFAKFKQWLTDLYRGLTDLKVKLTPEVRQMFSTMLGAEAVSKRQEALADKNTHDAASWVIRNKETGEVLFETYDRKKVDALNTAKYEAVPIDEYLPSLNERGAMQGRGEASQNPIKTAKPGAARDANTKGTSAAVGDQVRRGEVGGRVYEGEVQQTSSGRNTTPFPKVRNKDGKLFRDTETRVTRWLIQNALDEANARGDRFNARSFEQDAKLNGKNVPQASKDSAEEYLFGEQPTVVKSLLRDLLEGVEPAQGGNVEFYQSAIEEGVSPDTLRREHEATERAYGGKPAFDRAKADGRTKLNFRQWVQVRTARFKKWFGDWEAAAHRQFLEGDPVAELTGNEFAQDGRKLTDKVPEWFNEKYSGHVTNPELGSVLLDADGVKTSLGHGPLYRNKAIGFAAVPNIIESGRILNRSDNWKGRGYATALIVAPIDIGGKRFVGAVVVKKSKDQQRFHLEEVYAMEYLQEAAVKTGAVASSGEVGEPGAAHGDILSVLVPVMKINPAEVSKVTDPETGEPMVVYHGSPENWNVFDFGQARSSADIPAAFFTTAVDEAEGYGDVRQFFLNIRNATEKPISQMNGTKELERLKEQNFDGTFVDDSYAGETRIEYAVFSPNQIKSATSNTGEYAAGNDDIRFSVADTNNHAQTFTPDPYDAKEFAAAVERIAALGNAPHTTLTMGETPAVLRALGARALPVQIAPSVIHKASRDKHKVPVSVLKNLPALLANPVAVFDSHTEQGAVVALVEAEDAAGNPVLVAVHMDAGGSGFNRVNKIASVYGKNSGTDTVLGWMSDGSLRYFHKEKASQWLHANRLQLPEANTIERLNPNAITEADVVNGDGINASRPSPTRDRATAASERSRLEAQLEQAEHNVERWKRLYACRSGSSAARTVPMPSPPRASSAPAAPPYHSCG
ncbi:hypothetical protein AGMMS49960_18130 [Betaproteobacteria bacterium]|nr:hypothetical protein AGMMS49960_18130 [Betaproteobacteria bacterium]